jgi:hypothetical protein
MFDEDAVVGKIFDDDDVVVGRIVDDDARVGGEVDREPIPEEDWLFIGIVNVVGCAGGFGGDAVVVCPNDNSVVEENPENVVVEVDGLVKEGDLYPLEIFEVVKGGDLYALELDDEGAL